MNSEELSFVLRHFSRGRLDTRRAYARFLKDSHQRQTRRWWRVAAAILIIVAAGAVVWLRQPEMITIESGTAQRIVVLDDSTRVILAPHSYLAYKSPYNRQLTMGGEATFAVRHDQEHPFYVEGRIGGVRVLGTEFTLSETDSTSSVKVKSGRIRFSSVKTGENVELTRGMAAIIRADSLRPRITVEAKPLPDHTFRFSNTPLRQVLDTLSAYYDVKITASSTQKRLTGDFSSASLDDIISMIETVLGVKIKVEK